MGTTRMSETSSCPRENHSPALGWGGNQGERAGGGGGADRAHDKDHSRRGQHAEMGVARAGQVQGWGRKPEDSLRVSHTPRSPSLTRELVPSSFPKRKSKPQGWAQDSDTEPQHPTPTSASRRLQSTAPQRLVQKDYSWPRGTSSSEATSSGQ